MLTNIGRAFQAKMIKEGFTVSDELASASIIAIASVYDDLGLEVKPIPPYLGKDRRKKVRKKEIR